MADDASLIRSAHVPAIVAGNFAKIIGYGRHYEQRSAEGHNRRLKWRNPTNCWL
jgi:hypothetical protein